MNHELAKTTTTALVQFIDRERPEGSLCCSSAECEKMEKAVEGVVCYGSKGAYVESDWLGTTDVEVYGDSGDKVKIVIIKDND